MKRKLLIGTVAVMTIAAVVLVTWRPWDGGARLSPGAGSESTEDSAASAGQGGSLPGGGFISGGLVPVSPEQSVRFDTSNYCDAYLLMGAFAGLDPEERTAWGDDYVCEWYEDTCEDERYIDVAVLIAHEADPALAERLVDECGRTAFGRCRAAEVRSVRAGIERFYVGMYGEAGKAELEKYSDIVDEVVEEKLSEDWRARALSLQEQHGQGATP